MRRPFYRFDELLLSKPIPCSCWKRDFLPNRTAGLQKRTKQNHELGPPKGQQSPAPTDDGNTWWWEREAVLFFLPRSPAHLPLPLVWGGRGRFYGRLESKSLRILCSDLLWDTETLRSACALGLPVLFFKIELVTETTVDSQAGVRERDPGVPCSHNQTAGTDTVREQCRPITTLTLFLASVSYASSQWERILRTHHRSEMAHPSAPWHHLSKKWLGKLTGSSGTPNFRAIVM